MKVGAGLLAAFVVLCAAAWPAESPAARSVHAPAATARATAGYALVIFGTDTVRAEVAATPEERQRGLMFRDAVPEGTGMLFVFQGADIQGIWMKDTYVPLDVAFLDHQIRVVSVAALEPQDTTVIYSTGPVTFALEVARGWFATHGVGPGAKAEIVFGRR